MAHYPRLSLKREWKIDTGSPVLPFSQREAPPLDPLYLIRPSSWLGSPERVLILHPCVHLKASLWSGPSFTLNYILWCYNTSQATDVSTTWHGHGASHSPFSYNGLSLCLLYCLATVSLSGRVKHGFVIAGIGKRSGFWECT